VVLTTGDSPRVAAYRARVALPTGTGTVLMTDIEGSTRLFADLGPEYAGLVGIQTGEGVPACDGHVGRLTGTDAVDHPVNAIPCLEATGTRLGRYGERLLAEGAGMRAAEVVRYALRKARAL
jgi:hypothetical protein